MLFNQILSLDQFDTSQKVQQMLNEQVHKDAMKAIDTCLNNKGVEEETLKTLLLSECRILYRNHDMCQWVEDQFNMFFTETHTDLKVRTQDANTKDAIDDVTSMVEFEKK